MCHCRHRSSRDTRTQAGCSFPAAFHLLVISCAAARQETLKQASLTRSRLQRYIRRHSPECPAIQPHEPPWNETKLCDDALSDDGSAVGLDSSVFRGHASPLIRTRNFIPILSLLAQADSDPASCARASGSMPPGALDSAYSPQCSTWNITPHVRARYPSSSCCHPPLRPPLHHYVLFKLDFTARAELHNCRDARCP